MNISRRSINRKVSFVLCIIVSIFSFFTGVYGIIKGWNINYVLFFAFLFVVFFVFSMVIYAYTIRQRDFDKIVHEKEAAEKDAEIKLQYLANMAHEIRTPINAILGYDELILREYNDPTLRQYAGNIKAASNTLLALINDSLDYSRIEAGKMELIPANYDLGIMVEELISMISPRALAKGLDMKCLVNKDTPRILYGDSDRLKQCIINILTNAVKYTEEGEITFSVDYEEVSDSSKSGKTEILLKIAVKDTGIGIRDEDLKRLYSPFERIEERKNKAVEGSGLGISIVRRILSLMNSELLVESEYGKGSNFHFEVKQEVIRSEPIGDYELTYAKSIVKGNVHRRKFVAPKARILVVDDADLNLSVMEELLKETRIQVDSALSAATGLELAEKNDYDLIFIDLKMPGMNGGEMLYLLHGDKKERQKRSSIASFGKKNDKALDKTKGQDKRNADTPCIALTAGAVVEVQSEYTKLGFADYLLKPIVYKELETVLLHYLPGEKISMIHDKPRKNEPAQPSLMTYEKFDEALEILRKREG